MPKPPKTHEATKRVLYHLVNSYQTWRNELGMPNEFTDDAVRIAEEHLRLVNWFPEDAGWLPDNVPTDGTILPKDPVLDLIDAELDRLREPMESVPRRLASRKRAWNNGVAVARLIAAEHLQVIRDAYLVEKFTQDADALGLKELDPDD